MLYKQNKQPSLNLEACLWITGFATHQYFSQSTHKSQ